MHPKKDRTTRTPSNQNPLPVPRLKIRSNRKGEIRTYDVRTDSFRYMPLLNARY